MKRIRLLNVVILISMMTRLVASAATLEEELFRAIVNDDSKAVSRLLKNGAPHTFEDKETESTPLIYAVGQLNADVVRTLIRSGAKADFRTKQGETALHVAAYSATHPIWELLIKSKPNVNITNASGATPLMVASHIGNVAAVESLLKAKADVDVQMPDGNTALLLACQAEEREKDRRAVALLLLKAKADPNHRNRENYNALYYSVANEDDKMAKVLIENGATIRKDSETDKETWEIAKEPQNAAILKYLESLLKSR